MRSTITPLIVLAFLGISVFGFAALHNGMHGSNCLASTLGGGVCASTGDGFGFASFHLNAFKMFSNATFELALVVLVLFAVIGVAMVSGGRGLDIFGGAIKSVLENVPDDSETSFRLDRWLTLLEKRDPTLSF